jgi:hypothetical protein
MRKILLFVFLINTIFVLATDYFFGLGFQGRVNVNHTNGEWRISIVPVTSLSSGGIESGGLVFNVLRDRGFVLVSRLSLKPVTHVSTFHCEAIDVNTKTLEVFVADGTHGLKIYKFFGSHLYKLVQTLSVKGWVNSLAYHDNFILAGTEVDGLFLFKRNPEGFEEVQRLFPSGIDRMEGGITVHAIAASGERFFVAAGSEGTLVLEFSDGLLRVTGKLTTNYALDVAVGDKYIAVVEPQEKAVSFFDVLDLKPVASLYFDVSPVQAVIAKDWEDGKDYLLCRFNDSVSIIEVGAFQELFSMKGAFFGIVKPVYGID